MLVSIQGVGVEEERDCWPCFPPPTHGSLTSRRFLSLKKAFAFADKEAFDKLSKEALW